jgi:hypothetical protein
MVPILKLLTCRVFCGTSVFHAEIQGVCDSHLPAEFTGVSYKVGDPPDTCPNQAIVLGNGLFCYGCVRSDVFYSLPGIFH